MLDSSNGLWAPDFWTSSGLFRGIWLHLWMTWIPIPLADAGYWRKEKLKKDLCCFSWRWYICNHSISFVIFPCFLWLANDFQNLFQKWALYTITYRFDDPLLPRAAVLPGLTEQFDILRKNKRPRKKAELLLAKATLHLGQISPQSVFPADLKCSWKVVQLGQKRWDLQLIWYIWAQLK